MGAEGDEEIYQIPIVDSQSAGGGASAVPVPVLVPAPGGVLKRSDTSGDISDKKGQGSQRGGDSFLC